jgi:hypothetical protein
VSAKYWIKLYHEIVDDPKMGRLPDSLWRRVIEMFLLAGELDEDGFLPPLPDMAWRLRSSEEMMVADLNKLASLRIVELRDYTPSEQRWHVVNFANRQGASSDAERMREYRKRKKEKEAKRKKEEDTDTDTYRTVTRVTLRNEQVTQYAYAIAAVVKTPLSPGVNEDAFEDAAHALIGWDVLLEKVEGFAEWWKANGYYNGRPSLKSFLAEFRNYTDGVRLTPAASSNGHGAEAAWQSAVEHAKRGKPPTDATLLAAVREFGWPRLQAMTEKELSFAKGEFANVYKRHAAATQH